MFKPVPSVLLASLRRISITALCLSIVFFASAQYCSPTVNSTGLYINQIKFDYSSSIVGGIAYPSGNNGYSQTIGSSSGTIKRYWGSGIWYNIANSSGVSKTYIIKLFADWNNDGDFNDFMEDNCSNGGTISAATNLGTGLTIFPPLSASGTIRIRIAMCEGSTPPTPCGSFTGEVEDYKVVIAANVAPVLDNAGTPFINDMLVSQTNAEGFSVNQLIASAGPDVNLATDGDDISSNQMVPRGLAIFDQSAANGTWQYKIGAGAWTAIGAVTSSNALLVLGDGNQNYQPAVRLRFVPTGAGTATISFRLWDGTSGTNGGYANIVSTGSSTAFSNSTEVASVNVATTLGSTVNVFLSTQQNTIYNTAINRSTGKMQDPKNLFGTTHDNYYSGDITLDPSAAKLYWIGGANQDRISSSNADGSNVQASVITGLNFGMGVAVSGSKIFYADWTPGLFSANLDGSNVTSLTGGAGQLDPSDIWDIGDIEYANNKIYFLYYSGASSTYCLMSANTDGTSLTEVYSTSNYIRGLHVTATQAYWTEQDPNATPVISYVKMKSLSGGSVTLLATETGRIFYDIMPDENNSLVYFVTSDGNASELRKVSTTGGTVSIVLSLNGTVNSFAFDVTGTTLPVTLVRYDAKLLADMTAELSWATSNEMNTSHFIIEKSNDAVNFTQLATVQAKAASNDAASYSFIDSKLANGVTYYRLKEAAFDGKVKDLGIRRIRIATPTLLDAYPNPITGTTLTVNTGYEFTGTIAYQLFDAAGRTVLTGALKQQQQTIETGKLPAGYYVLSLADGQRIQLTKN